MCCAALRGVGGTAGPGGAEPEVRASACAFQPLDGSGLHLPESQR